MDDATFNFLSSIYLSIIYLDLSMYTLVSLINVESAFIVFEDFAPIPRLLIYY